MENKKFESFQEVFNASVSGIFEQGKLAQVDGEPHYITPDGSCRCAVGVLMTPEEVRLAQAHSDAGNDYSVDDIADEDLLPERLVPFTNQLGRLQRAHDRADDVDDFIERTNFVAEELGISPWKLGKSENV